MNQYRITVSGKTIATLYAITPGAARLAALRHFPTLFLLGVSRVRAERAEDVADEVARLANDPEAIDWCMEQYHMTQRRAYRVAHHFARERVSQRHDRFSDPLGDWHGRNE